MTNTPGLYRPATSLNIDQVVNEQANTLSQLQTGVKPFVPVFKTAFARRHTEVSSQVFFTFPADSHIWSASLTFTIATNSAYAGAISKCFADLTTGSGIALLTVELSVATITDHDSNTDSNIWNGLTVVAGDTLVLNINNATSIPNLSQQASCIVGYATP